MAIHKYMKYSGRLFSLVRLKFKTKLYLKKTKKNKNKKKKKKDLALFGLLSWYYMRQNSNCL